MKKIEKAANVIISKCLNLKKPESLIIVTDEPLLEKAMLLFTAACKKTKHVQLILLNQQQIKSRQIDTPVSTYMASSDTLIAITSYSISHTDARRKACRKGVRCISMPNILDASFTRIANMNFEKISRLSQKLKDILTIGKEARITSPNGTELIVPINKGSGYADTGLIHTAGAFSNLPAGEAAIAPDEGQTWGTLIIDSGMGVIPEDKDRLTITVKNGRAARIKGGNAALRLRRMLSPFGSSSRIIAELGIGTNKYAKISGYSLEDEKVLGTVHIALGNNVSFGGQNNVPIHVDGVVYNATLVIDGRKILDEGKLVLN
jgi:leucyl aminopeptidase (aminopeptidase T)